MNFLFKICLAVATVAIAQLASAASSGVVINEMSTEMYSKLEIYDQKGRELEVSVDYSNLPACQKSSLYTLTDIDEETKIVTVRMLPRRAYCPPPSQWRPIEHGVKFKLAPSGSSGFTFMYLIVPKGSKVEAVAL